MAQSSGPPYMPTTASLGGVPTIPLDIPIDAVLLLLFVASAVTHMTIFQVNKKRDHKFLFSGMLFGFSMARITTLVMRIVWATRPTNINVAIAAQIFVAAGVLLLFIINLIFAQRLLRAYHPHIGWSKPVKYIFIALYVLIVCMLIMVIVATVYSFFTLDPNTRRICRDIQLFVGTVLAVIAFLPVPITLLTILLPRSTQVEKFGTGKIRTKVALLIFSSLILTLGAGFRVGVNFTTPRPLTDPAWYHSKACFYVFNFAVEIVVVYLYAAMRVDLRFHIPDGSSSQGDYASGYPRHHETMEERLEDRIDSEANAFGGKEAIHDDELSERIRNEEAGEMRV